MARLILDGLTKKQATGVMHQKILSGLIVQCPYVSESEFRRFWAIAKRMASSKRLRRGAYWNVVNKITIAMAKKLDEERRVKDENDWKAEIEAKQAQQEW